MNIKVLMLIAVLSLQGCAALDLAKAVLPSNSGVSVDAQVGKEANKQIILGDQSKVEVEADNVAGDMNTVTNKVDTAFTGNLETGSFTINNMPTKDVLWYASLCIFLLGVLFPSPFEIVRWIRTQAGKISKV